MKQCCQISSGRKGGRSFRSARSAMEEKDAMENAVPCSTWYRNKWAVEMLKQWQYYHAQKGQASDEVDVAIQGVGTPFEAINSESIAYCHWLGKSVQEVKQNGERYPSRTLHGLVTGLIISRKSLG